MPPIKQLPTKYVMYRATVRTNHSIKQYIVATEGTLKQRIYAHKLSFSNRSYSTNTSLSTYTRHLRNERLNCHNLGNPKTCIRLQQDIKNAFFVSMRNLQLSLTHQKTPYWTKNPKDYPNTDTRTNIYFRISTHTQNPCPPPPSTISTPPPPLKSTTHHHIKSHNILTGL